jgi:hypothetical protein
MLRRALFAVILFTISTPAFAQWLDRKAPGIPRLPDGKPNLAAPTPRTADGKPDMSGMWEADSGAYIGNLAVGVDIPFQPWAEALYKERRENASFDDPEARCLPLGLPKWDILPYLTKIVETPGMILMLYEDLTSFRQVYIDGRELPKDPNPTWMGYSVGRWEGDTLVVEVNGLNGKSWLDAGGHPATVSLHLIERFRRPDFGHMELTITIDDPKAYTKPWNSMLIKRHLLPDTDILEFYCQEGNHDPEHMSPKKK